MSQASSIKNAKRPPKGPGAPRGAVVPGEKAKDLKGGTKKLFSYLAKYKLKIFTVIVFAALSTVFTILSPKVLAKATDELARGVMAMLTGVGDGISFEYIGRILLICFGLYVLSSAFQFIQVFIMSGVSSQVSYNLRTEITKKMNRLPVSYYNRVSYGDVLSRITNDVDTINQNLNQTMTQAISSVTTLVGVLVMMLSISVPMTLIALCILPVSALITLAVVSISQKHFKAQQDYLGAVNGQVEEIYGGQLVVKAFNGEADAIDQFSKDNDKLYESAWKANFLSGLMQPLMHLVGNLGYVAICIIGASMVSKGTLTVGGIQAFIQYIRNFTQPITQIAQISNQFQAVIAASERVFEFLEEEEEKDEAVKLRIADADIRGDVKFEHVNFAYEGSDKTVIKDFSADVKAGMKVALVGPTGAGKTTMVKLLMRFHELTGGAIYVDGHNITDFARSDLRSEFGMVLQDTWLYRGSIKDNIRYGKLDATDEEVYAAAKAAQVDHFVRTLPGGYDMEINEEASNISAGQKQLLTIARALLADSQIMILDEATSSVDTRTEVLIQKAMDNLMRGRTSFIIAHRLSTIRNADLILCINDGDIVEQGTHEELMALDGFYANLYNSQFEVEEASA